MEVLYTTELTIPMYQVGLLMVLTTLGLLFSRIKLALLINFLFALYWGYWLNRENVIGTGIPEIDAFTIGYFGFGFLIVIFVVIGFMLESTR
ncbi:MAG TPA: hypothetical protein HPP59_04560 [Deltaproteobacteria bacterium]|nr:hypothetical protein [Deltaproteobacteria bacterium]HIJ41412.1 hypothetical protein [Deltaproteobacteria bacterium]